ncbi:hypothetical protein N431DRAFT_331672 [Stipitochalara longipes BDJ]|nr:hypothetical protein N431DRAFT_331672 [Stipitochalara longipes BDJ]
MSKRTETANERTISLPSPDGRVYDFTKTPEEAPHAVNISVLPKSTFTGPIPYWNERYKVLLTCIAGRVHTFWGTGPYSNVDSFFGAGSSETYDAFTLHYWQRSEQWQTAKGSTPSHPHNHAENEQEPLLTEDRDIEKGIDHQEATDDVLTVAISPSPNYWDQKHRRRHELFYRNWASMELDAALYPYLSTTPLPIRLLFKLPRLLFPDLLRNWLIAYFLSIQLLVLFSAFDHHPHLGSWPLMTLYALAHATKYFGPGAPQIPQWVCRCQWTSMLFISHWRVWVWSGIGRWVFGMQPTYEEYTPERLKDALDPMPGE